MIDISFWGSPLISAHLLESLISSKKFNIKFIVTQEDKPRTNRSKEAEATPVKKTALSHNIPVFTPKSLKKNSDVLFAELSQKKVDLNVVFAYGKLIPERFFSLPAFGTVNFHASLLPQLRGASPIESSLIRGFEKTGWTMQKMTEALDAGDVYFTQETTVLWEDDFFSLAGRLMDELLSFSASVLEKFCQGKLSASPQKEAEATYCSKLEPSMGKINWPDSVYSIRNQARALSGRGGIYTYFMGKKVKLFIEPAISQEQIESSLDKKGQAGSVTQINDDLMWVACGDQKSLPVGQVQPEGKRKISIREFINGYRIQTGQNFSDNET